MTDNAKGVSGRFMRDWSNQAVATIEADFQRSADTHLIKVELPSIEGIDLYLKDESTHPTGSLKHRLARSLFLYGICNGSILEGTTIIEASSGSTAVSEAYFARLLGLAFVSHEAARDSREALRVTSPVSAPLIRSCKKPDRICHSSCSWTQSTL